jgi:hypothetical protein
LETIAAVSITIDDPNFGYRGYLDTVGMMIAATAGGYISHVTLDGGLAGRLDPQCPSS